MSFVCTGIVEYADDIIMIAPAMHGLQLMLSNCERKLISIDICLNVNKYLSMLLGPRFNVNAVHLVTNDGRTLQWVGVFYLSGSNFYSKCMPIRLCGLEAYPLNVCPS